MDGDEDDDGADFLLKDNGDDLDLRLERLEVSEHALTGCWPCVDVGWVYSCIIKVWQHTRRAHMERVLGCPVRMVSCVLVCAAGSCVAAACSAECSHVAAEPSQRG